MNIDLVLATGLVYTLLGALILCLSHRSLYVRASRIVAGYPKVIAQLRAQRHDGRFGLLVLVCGNVLQVCAAFGYTVSAEYWRVPVYGALAAGCVYMVWRFIAVRMMRHASERGRRGDGIQMYESRRSMMLLEAARREAAMRRAREAAQHSSARTVVYVAEEWECRWWSDRLGVTPDALRAAVREVGPMLEELERYFAVDRKEARHAIAA